LPRVGAFRAHGVRLVLFLFKHKHAIGRCKREPPAFPISLRFRGAFERGFPNLLVVGPSKNSQSNRGISLCTNI